MHKYYLFSIKKEFFGLYIKNEHILYRTLESLYKLDNPDLSYGLSLYNQICNIIDVKRLNDYFNYSNNKRIGRNYLVNFEGESTIFDIHYSCIICLTKKDIPRIFRVINYYDKFLFACDFKYGRHFFLNKSNTYNKYKINDLY